MNFDILDALWKSRHQPQDWHDFGRLLEAQTRETVDLAARYELDWRRARADQFAAMQHLESGDKTAARRLFECGQDIVLWTLAGEPERVEGRFWWAVNALESGRIGGKWTAFWAIRAARPQLELAAQLDETFHFAGPLRVLGRIAHLAPKNAGGDAEKSAQLFERALEIADNSTTRLYFGELLRDLGDESAAQAQFEAILGAPDAENWMWEQARDRGKAREHLAK